MRSVSYPDVRRVSRRVVSPRGGGGGGDRNREGEGGPSAERYSTLSPADRFHTKIGSDVSHLNVLLTVESKGTGQCPNTTALREKGDSKRTGT